MSLTHQDCTYKPLGNSLDWHKWADKEIHWAHVTALLQQPCCVTSSDKLGHLLNNCDVLFSIHQCNIMIQTSYYLLTNQPFIISWKNNLYNLPHFLCLPSLVEIYSYYHLNYSVVTFACLSLYFFQKHICIYYHPMLTFKSVAYWEKKIMILVGITTCKHIKCQIFLL